MLGLTSIVVLLSVTLASSQPVDINAQKGQYWGEKGLANPSRRLREIADFALLYFNATTEFRAVLLFTIATPASKDNVLPRLLENLASFKSHDQVDTNGNDATSLAEHTIVGTTNMDTQHACDKLAEKHRQKCYELDHGFNQGAQGLLSAANSKVHAYSVGLSRIKALIDLISMGYDVLYFDLHHYFFQNPLKYMYSHTRAPLVVSGTPSSGCRQLQSGPDGSLPDDHHRLDIAFMRSGPAAFRCMYNWLYWSTHTAHDVNDRPLDHHTFRNVMQECVLSLGKQVMSVEYLSPAAFPSECATKCGCRADNPVQPAPDGSCSKDDMSSWVGYLFSCTPNPADLDALLLKYGTMYRNAGIVSTR
ncbi:hypothetical protein Agub_g3863 [Astrephomene gubernaculifera]|uniref:Nucleotide-diphospho-sugar transferase domain-containing protein n=1 Tax=Astrephomene gubernaculifera TaxID=47775 RepID=A0AAD3DLB8_9CHLO|nr:hypothetical protein Agub_g3863 [Astrephomene gubernaculifera]